MGWREGIRMSNKLRGYGGLKKCPKCGSEKISAEVTSCPDYQHLIQTVTCEDCGSVFTELYACVNWEEL